MEYCSGTRGCGARVRWMFSVSGGRRAPMDPDPVPDGNVVLVDEAHYRVLTKKEMDKMDMPTLLPGESKPLRYKLHFATCPHADHFRRCTKCHKTPCECA